MHVTDPPSQQNWADYIDSLYVFTPPSHPRTRRARTRDGSVASGNDAAGSRQGQDRLASEGDD